MDIFGYGVANKSKSGEILDVHFSSIFFGNKKIELPKYKINSDSKQIIELNWNQKNLEMPIENVIDSYFKLHLLSNKFVLPNTINLDGLFSSLPNVAWTNIGPVSIAEIEDNLNLAKYESQDFYIKSLDKFPCLTDYIVPKKVRIADSRRVRLGAYLGEGTTVMHEGFVNFNAGTLGKAMIEGRISAGVIIGNNSDMGGGSSTMGTLSGGNENVISVGENCLLGANSGTGISLGNNCIVEAGLYITAGTKITRINNNKDEKVLKAIELSGESNLIYIRDSVSGKVIAKNNEKRSSLNETLHKND